MADTPHIVPYLSYRDGNGAIDFLTKVFGLELVLKQDGEDGALLHAELRHGNGMILMGTADLPKGSPGIYLVIDDVAAHHAKAVEAGIEIVYPPEKTEWGTERYRLKDPEGHEWTFGTYQPQTVAPDWG